VLLPIDSEHNAIFQCLPAQVQEGQAVQPHHGVERLWLTASGGPLRTLPLAELAHIEPEQALLHPNWRMGPKVSIDSATMANKALELVEALWLFGLPHERLSVLVHPQSIVHSLVEYADGSVLAQLGCPDMRTPIAHALAWPERIQAGVERLNLAKLGSLTFEEPNLERFPMLRLGFEVLRNPEVLAPIFNAANEVAVHQFLHGTISLPSIPSIATYCLERFSGVGVQTLDDALFLDAQVREAALAWIKDTH
jgi:1-deoxy-D-xylulose-5-phosphate reductoisomerase